MQEGSFKYVNKHMCASFTKKDLQDVACLVFGGKVLEVLWPWSEKALRRWRAVAVADLAP